MLEENPCGFGYVIEEEDGVTDTDIYGDYRPENRERRNYMVTCIQTCLLVGAVIFIIVLCANTVKALSFCDAVGSETPISEGMDIAEFNNSDYAWNGVPSETFEGKPYLLLVGPENGYYAIFEAMGGGVVVVPFASLEAGSDGWPHDTCGYLITWAP